MADQPEEKYDEDVMARERARRGVKEQVEDDKPIEMYLEDSFKNYVEEKYAVTDPTLLTDTSIL